MTAKEIEEVHFPNCTHFRVNCEFCCLPVLESERELHDCLLRQHGALHAIYKYFGSMGRKVHPLCQEGQPKSPIFEIPSINRMMYQNEASKRFDPDDMSDSSTSDSELEEEELLSHSCQS